MDILSRVGVAYIDLASRHWTGIAFRIITTAQAHLKQNVQLVKTGTIRRVAEFDETSVPPNQAFVVFSHGHQKWLTE